MQENVSDKNVELKTEQFVGDEIDISELLLTIWNGKWIVIVITFIFSVVSVFYAINQPNIYRAEALLAPIEQEQSLGGLQGQLGGLASLAGINLGGGTSNKTQLAIEILKSRNFASDFIEKHNVLPDLMAADSWNISDGSIAYNPELYDASLKSWKRKAVPPRKSKPSMQEAYKELINKMGVASDKDTGMVRVSVQHISPVVAKKWVDWLVEDINETMKMRDVSEAKKSTEFLSSQIAETKIADIRSVLYKLVEEQAKIIMFANVRDEYVFKTIDPALVPEEKAGPKRALICVLGAFFGGIFGIFVALIIPILKKS